MPSWRAASDGRNRSSSSRRAGRYPAARAAGSHTAGLVSNDTAVDALFKQSGVIRADTIDEMFDVAQCLDLQPLPAGARVAIITNAGGPGILAADACEAAGLDRAAVRAPTLAQPSPARLSSNASVGNPVDLVASAGPEAYEHAIVTAMNATEVDSVIVVYTPIDHAQTEGIFAAVGQAVANARTAGRRPQAGAGMHPERGSAARPASGRSRTDSGLRVSRECGPGTRPCRNLRALA